MREKKRVVFDFCLSLKKNIKINHFHHHHYHLLIIINHINNNMLLLFKETLCKKKTGPKIDIIEYRFFFDFLFLSYKCLGIKKKISDIFMTRCYHYR